MINRILSICAIALLSMSCYGQDLKKIQGVFNELKTGYLARDTSKAHLLAHAIFAKDVQITGTGEDEWFEGIGAAKNLLMNDWLYWMNLSIDTSKINLTMGTNTAFFRIPAKASMKFKDKEQAYNFALSLFKRNTDSLASSKSRLLAYAAESAVLINQIESGGLEIVYAIRLSGALVKENNRWMIKQLVYSFPYPMKRD